MRRMSCPSCSAPVYFDNFFCGSCQKQLAFSPQTLKFEIVGEPQAQYVCQNRKSDVCDWATEEGKPLCRSCRLNGVIPNLYADGENLRLWTKIEQAKRRFIYDALRFGLPIVDRSSDPQHGLVFEFKSSDLLKGDQKVMTGHDNGLITLDIDEADDAERERRRTTMREPYRTLVGHFRHEIGHYYWDLLLKNGPLLEEFRQIFGDDRQDYGQALQRHYDNGAPKDWPQNFISAYATMHPWEDWAETFANYVHSVSVLDTAQAFEACPPKSPKIADPYREENFDRLAKAFPPVVEAINEVNRSMGLADIYPFVVSPNVMKKLSFVHKVIHQAAKDAQAGVFGEQIHFVPPAQTAH